MKAKKFKVYYMVFIHLLLIVCLIGINSMHKTYGEALDQQEQEIINLMNIGFDENGTSWKVKYHSLNEEYHELYELYESSK